jgi:hypothetical protein
MPTKSVIQVKSRFSLPEKAAAWRNSPIGFQGPGANKLSKVVQNPHENFFAMYWTSPETSNLNCGRRARHSALQEKRHGYDYGATNQIQCKTPRVKADLP